ncbi:MAG TPA: hypothetical protein VN914_12995 [Polyangia bacterium]|nr:hypothetical protein [Polyangia bacterium]
MTPGMPPLPARRKQEYEALGYDPKKVFAALTRLKAAFAHKDFEAFAKLVTYPLPINRKSGGVVTVEKAADLRPHKELIFSAHNAAVVKAQTFQALLLKDEGAAVGKGEFLISGTCTDGGDKPCEYGVTAVDLR